MQELNILEVSFKLMGLSEEDLQEVGDHLAALGSPNGFHTSNSADRLLKVLAKHLEKQQLTSFNAGTNYEPKLTSIAGDRVRVMYEGSVKTLKLDLAGWKKTVEEEIKGVGRAIDEELAKEYFFVRIKGIANDYWYERLSGKIFKVRQAIYLDIGPDVLGFRNVPIEDVLVVIEGESSTNLIYKGHIEYVKTLKVQINSLIDHESWYKDKEGCIFTVIDYDDLNYYTIAEKVKGFFIAKTDCRVLE